MYGSLESLSERRPYFSLNMNSEMGIESGGGGSLGTQGGDLKIMLCRTDYKRVTSTNGG